MIRLLIALIIVALALTKLSGMLNKEVGSQAPEDTILGEAYEPYTRAQQFGEEGYEDALDAHREERDKQIDGG